MNSRQFENLFNQYYEELGRFAMKFLRCADLSDEIVQNVFVKFWEKRDDLDQVKNLKSYLYLSVRNACIDEIKKQNSVVDLNEHTESKEMHQQESSSIEFNELHYYTELALKALPDKCYSVFSLKRFCGLSNKEVAEELDISVKTVETQFTIALKKIKNYLAQYGLP